MLQHIQQLIQSGHHAEALQLVNSACTANPAQPDLWLLRASLQAQANDLNGVIDSCTRALALQPSHCAARFNLAVALQSQQRTGEAMEHYRTLLTYEPGHVAGLNNLGALLLETNQAEQAVQPLQYAVSLAPEFATAHNTLGLVYDRLSQHAQAQSHYRNATALDSNLSAAYSNLARSLHLQGNSALALTELEILIAQHPESADTQLLKVKILRESGQTQIAFQQLSNLARQSTQSAAIHYELAIEFNAQGDSDAAVRHYQAAIALQPNHARALCNMSSLLHQRGLSTEALALLDRAEHAAPNLPEIQINLSTIHWSLGHEQAALKHCLTALKLAPKRRDPLQRFSQIIGGSRYVETSAEIFAAIEDCLNDPGVDQQHLVPPIQAILLSDTQISTLGMRCQRGESPTWTDFLPLLTSAHTPLFEHLLQNTVLVNPLLERVLNAARHAALFEFINNKGQQTRTAQNKELQFLTALAHQCFNNEFVYSISEAEQIRTACLAASLDTRTTPSLTQALILALYGPLTTAGNCTALEQTLHASAVKAMPGLAAKHFDYPREEAALRKNIRELTQINDTTSQAVRDQYEESPYPRWLSVSLQEAKPYPASLRDTFAHFTPPDFGTPEIQTLVAGCGTGKHAILSAQRFRGSAVTAMDLSHSSLTYGLRKTRELGINSIEFFCGDILKLHELRKTFHIIESVGVLHHLRDPEAGLRSLRTLLAPNGLMNIGLYSTLARHAVYAAREHFNVEGGDFNLDTIRRARSEILTLPIEHPIRTVANMEDFYSLSDCRDLLFHTQERSYRLPEIAALLERNGLRFIGFSFPDPHIKLNYGRECPDDPTATDLFSWDRFEQRHPDTFIGMYVFWCQTTNQFD